MSKQELKGSTALTPKNEAPPPATIDYGEDVGAGFQNQTKDDIALPFIDILQPGSPEVIAAGRDGARAGDIINRVTGEIVDGNAGIVVVPAITEHCYTEWKPRPDGDNPNAKGGAGGGFVARHELDEEVCKRARTEAAFKKFSMPNGNDLIETFYVFGLQIDENGSTAPVAIAFGSTKIKAYKSWMYIARAIQVLGPNGRVNPPLFSHSYRITTKLVKKDQYSWYVPVISFAGNSAEESRFAPSDPIYQAAKGVMVAYNSGALKADYSKTTSDVTQAEGEKPPF